MAAMASPRHGGGRGGAELRAEMLECLVTIARADEPPRGSMAKMAAAKYAIDALDKEREWELAMNDRDPMTYLRKRLGTPAQAKELLLAMLDQVEDEEKATLRLAAASRPEDDDDGGERR